MSYQFNASHLEGLSYYNMKGPERSPPHSMLDKAAIPVTDKSNQDIDLEETFKVKLSRHNGDCQITQKTQTDSHSDPTHRQDNGSNRFIEPDRDLPSSTLTDLPVQLQGIQEDVDMKDGQGIATSSSPHSQLDVDPQEETSSPEESTTALEDSAIEHCLEDAKRAWQQTQLSEKYSKKDAGEILDYLQPKKKLIAKDFREILPRLVQYKINGKIGRDKGMWSPENKPNDWPDENPFKDPNNRGKMKIEEMKLMYNYLKDELLPIVLELLGTDGTNRQSPNYQEDSGTTEKEHEQEPVTLGRYRKQEIHRHSQETTDWSLLFDIGGIGETHYSIRAQTISYNDLTELGIDLLCTENYERKEAERATRPKKIRRDEIRSELNIVPSASVQNFVPQESNTTHTSYFSPSPSTGQVRQPQILNSREIQHQQPLYTREIQQPQPVNIRAFGQAQPLVRHGLQEAVIPTTVLELSAKIQKKEEEEEELRTTKSKKDNPYVQRQPVRITDKYMYTVGQNTPPYIRPNVKNTQNYTARTNTAIPSGVRSNVLQQTSVEHQNASDALAVRHDSMYDTDDAMDHPQVAMTTPHNDQKSPDPNIEVWTDPVRSPNVWLSDATISPVEESGRDEDTPMDISPGESTTDMGQQNTGISDTSSMEEFNKYKPCLMDVDCEYDTLPLMVV